MRNSVPRLLNSLRPTLGEISKWLTVSLGLAQQWQQGTRQPSTEDRARLVKEARKHARILLQLAAYVEREGNSRAHDSTES